MSDPTSDVEEIIVMEHHDPEEALADLPLSVETVLQLSVEQLREKLLELGIDPKGRPKPQLQLELLQVFKFELVAPRSSQLLWIKISCNYRRISCNLRC